MSSLLFSEKPLPKIALDLDGVTVYLLHFSQPLGDPGNPRGQAQHYIGSADNVAQRVASHQLGHGAAIMRACKDRGIDFRLGRTWPGGRGRAPAEELAQGAGAMPYLQREGRWIMPAWALTSCEQCGASMGQASKGRPRRFCSAACKQAEYRRRVTKGTRTGYTLSEGQIIHGAGATSSPASAGQPGSEVRA